MGSAPSRLAETTVAEDSEQPHISTQSPQNIELQDPKMALAFDSQIHHQDDLGHDTLMGLQELDSTLAIFEETADRASPSDNVSDVIRDSTPSTHTNEVKSSDFHLKSESGNVPCSGSEASGISKYACPGAARNRVLKIWIFNVCLMRFLTNSYSDPYAVVSFRPMELLGSNSKTPNPQ